MGAIIIVDAFWGDSGKGKIAAYLSQRSKATFCVRAGTGISKYSVCPGDGLHQGVVALRFVEVYRRTTRHVKASHPDGTDKHYPKRVVSFLRPIPG